MGNQAALSGLLRVPQGCLSGADVAVTVCKSIFDGEVYGSFRHMEIVKSAYADRYIDLATCFSFKNSAFTEVCYVGS